MLKSTLPSQLFFSNRERLFEIMEDESSLVIFGNTHFKYTPSSELNFKQSANFLYLTGIDYPDCAVVLNKSAGKCSTIFFAPEITEIKRQWDSILLDEEKVKAISGIDEIEFHSHLVQSIADVLLSGKTTLLYTEKSKTSGFDSYVSHKKYLNSQLTRRLGGVNKQDASRLLEKLRMQKSPWELDAIKESINLTAGALRSTLKELPVLKSESSFLKKLSIELLERESDGYAFDPIIAAGKNSCVLHYISNNDSFKDKEHLLLDIGARKNFYHTDITRSVPLGKPGKDYQKVFDAVHAVYRHVLSELKPGITIKKMNELTSQAIENQLLELDLLKICDVKNQDPKNPAYRKYYMHSAGHHLGLEVHDVGSRLDPLPENAVITLEPGIYWSSKGIGVRLENDILLTSSGAEELSGIIPMDYRELVDG